MQPYWRNADSCKVPANFGPILQVGVIRVNRNICFMMIRLNFTKDNLAQSCAMCLVGEERRTDRPYRGVLWYDKTFSDFLCQVEKNKMYLIK